MTPGPHEPPSYDELDPFDLPGWLGEREVTWTSERDITAGHRVEASYLIVSSAAARGAKPHEFESPNTNMRFRFICVKFPTSPVAARTVRTGRRR